MGAKVNGFLGRAEVRFWMAVIILIAGAAASHATLKAEMNGLQERLELQTEILSSRLDVQGDVLDLSNVILNDLRVTVSRIEGRLEHNGIGQ